jgi:DNA repair exonuclease SbcCD ATPase subunit
MECPILKEKYNLIYKEKEQEILKLNEEINDYKKQLELERDSISYYNDMLESIRNKEEKVRQKLTQLKSAFQFADYKYTKADIVIYDEAVKILDTFAGEYIKEWLSSLSVIINNLLQPINISVEFTADKDFLHVYDNEQMLKYDQLSKGQKTFLGCLFKFAILMQQNKSGIVILDDGLNDIDWINFKNLINIIKTLPFQAICVYQGLQEKIEDTKHFLVIREKGISNVKTE